MAKRKENRDEGYSLVIQIGCLILMGVAICADALSASYDVSPYLLLGLGAIVAGVDKERIIKVLEAIVGRK